MSQSGTNWNIPNDLSRENVWEMMARSRFGVFPFSICEGATLRSVLIVCTSDTIVVGTVMINSLSRMKITAVLLFALLGLSLIGLYPSVNIY